MDGRLRRLLFGILALAAACWALAVLVSVGSRLSPAPVPPVVDAVVMGGALVALLVGTGRLAVRAFGVLTG